jgi:hypothetical protein
MNFHLKLLKFLNKMYTYIVIRLSGYFIVSIFINFYILLPTYNIYRAFSQVYFNFYISTFLLINILILWGVFKKYNSIYIKALHLIFCDILVDYRHLVTLGTFYMKNYTYLFAIYLFLSIGSFRLSREYPKILWIYIFYCICVLFRNFFIVPALGFAFILNVNKKQSEKLNLDDEELVLFKNTSLINDMNFCEIVINWIYWLDEIKPSPAQRKKISYFSIGSSFLWCFLIIYHYILLIEIEGIGLILYSCELLLKQETNKAVIINDNSKFKIIYQNIVLKITQQIQIYSGEHNKYKQKNDFFDTYFNISKIFQLKDNVLELREDYRILIYSIKSNLNQADFKIIMKNLTEKYTPEYKNYFNESSDT